MQNDLISKQSVIEKMWELYNSYGNDAEVYDELTTEAINREFSRLQKAIEDMETAYDVEKVVAEADKVLADLNVVEILSHFELDKTIQKPLCDFLCAFKDEIGRLIRNGGKE